MKPSRKVWIGLGGVAVVAAVAFVSKRQPDELDFIRKYKPTSEKLVNSGWGFNTRKFTFEQIPVELHAELGTSYRASRHWKVAPYRFFKNGLRGDVSRENTMVTVMSLNQPSWLERQWEPMKRWVGGANP